MLRGPGKSDRWLFHYEFGIEKGPKKSKKISSSPHRTKDQSLQKKQDRDRSTPSLMGQLEPFGAKRGSY